MRNFSKKLAFVLAAAMVFTAFAPAAKADAAEKMAMNREAQTLYVNEGVNDKGAETLPEGLYGNVQEYDFYVKNKPANYAKELKFAWASSDEKVATVDNVGLTKAVGVGTATITCTITDKATGDPVTEVSAKVTVKANAADVVITNAEDYEDFVVADERVIDLNRAMYDEDGNKTTKRGTYVTDYTKWVAEFDGEAVDAAVVAIDQATGKFTFAEDAPAGEYELYCQTYQSDKYNQVTAESDPVVVTVEEAAKEIDDVTQKTVKKFVVTFTSPVEGKLTNNDVTVTRLVELKSGLFKYPEKVKTVTTSKDGMSAEVEIFNDFLDKQNYNVAVNGFGDVDKVMTVGVPETMEVYAKTANETGNEQVVFLNEQAELAVRFFNAEGVDITTEDMVKKAYYRLETRATDGSFYIGSNKLTIKKDNVYPVVIAEYSFMNGKELKKLTADNDFCAIKRAAVTIDTVSKWTVNGNWDQPSTTMRKSTTPKLEVMFLKSDGKTEIKTAHNQTIENGAYKVTIEAMTPDVAVIKADGTIKAFKTDTASFYVNLHTRKENSTSYDEGVPYRVITVDVEADAAFSYIKLGDNEQDITIGTANGFCTKELTLTSYDNYNKEIDFVIDDSKNISIECTMDGYQKNAFADAFALVVDGAKAKITVNAQAMKEAFADDHKPQSGTCAVAYFDIKYNNQTVNLTVTVQEPSYKVEDDQVIYEGNYLNIEASATYVDAARYVTANDWNDNTEKAKAVTFNVYELNNTVKVGKLAFGEYPENGDAKAVSTGAYVFQVLRNGKAYDADFDPATGTVTVKFSTTTPFSNAAVSGSTVSYKDMGEGSYEFVLYRCYGEGDERTLVQEMSEPVTVGMSSAGAYNREGDVVDNDVTVTSEAYSAAAAAEILKCFVIKDKDGNAVVDGNGVIKKDKYFVDYEAPLKSGYVYVKKITFYEAVDTNVYVAYDVDIDTILVNNSK